MTYAIIWAEAVVLLKDDSEQYLRAREAEAMCDHVWIFEASDRPQVRARPPGHGTRGQARRVSPDLARHGSGCPVSRHLGSIRYTPHMPHRRRTGCVLSVLASKIQTWSHMASASRARRYCPGSSRIVVSRRTVQDRPESWFHPGARCPKSTSAEVEMGAQ